ncbi:N-carbamoylputrescine amidase [Glacieibacterium frigidum]|uniref:N-carbamoylputrescine amidase n=1 Tax=Glacieibacterium frigidum TaxID=2593303 RepID=A0A552U7E9_9SPHN|nr:N-carbamoylputrescine amidase [Glacieibacterium frigidum]TRW14145.1 N-carbamoylputrescine amidase [Glacieibacterium frigidum]
MTITAAALQLSFSDDMDRDIAATADAVRAAAQAGAQVILPPELFQGYYFCRHERDEFFARAFPADAHPAIETMQAVARDTGTYIPTSFFERDGPHYYNSLAMIDDRGAVMGIYRKSHIPDGPGYEEKFYFRPGNTGFKVWDTRHGRIGVGICWDQWFPETARAMMLMGAEILFYPTAIGSEPAEPNLDTRRMWIRAMIGHAVSNVVPVVAANRTGVEEDQRFYGNSFIADQRGDIVSELGTDEQGHVIATFDLAEVRANRAAFGFFRDRRPELYGRLSEDR